MDTKKLRQKILDLAIRGKLVPQDPNDEPASVLLERIRAEKEQLIKEGKIKRSKKSAATDKSHYENVPFEIPKSWVLSDFSELVTLLSGRDLESNDCNSNREGIPYLIGASNIVDGKINITRWTTRPLVISKRGDILISCKGTIGEVVTNVIGEIHIARQFMAIQTLPMVYADYIELYIKSIVNNIKRNARGVIPGISREDILQREIALPPLEEQKRIVIEVEKWLDYIADIEAEKDELESHIKKTKSKILDLAISGKLVPQDPNDEPAIELLKRINPGFKPCDNSHYENLPPGWAVCRLEDILDYEQPQAYIVNNTDYSDEYETPVLTAGKSFIIGYTNETNGICDRLPVIIFDDFTTDSKLVDFPFKVKSSAMKILRTKGEINIDYIAYYMSITRLIGDTHKRYWISEYSKLLIPIPPYQEQLRIVETIETIFDKIHKITAELS